MKVLNLCLWWCPIINDIESRTFSAHIILAFNRVVDATLCVFFGGFCHSESMPKINGLRFGCYMVFKPA